MDIRQEITSLTGKEQSQKIAAHIGNEQEKFDALMEVFYTGPYRLTQRAAGVMSHCVDAHPGLIVPHFKKMIHVLRNSPSDAVKRNIVRAWQWVPIPEAHLDDVADLCFTFLSTQQEAVAVKVFAMTVLLNITRQIPELKNELQILIEDQMPYGSAAFRSRGSKILKALEKIVSKTDTAL